MLIRKLFRTLCKYKAQFISMIIMTALGVGIFIGFNIEWYSIEKNVEIFFEETGFSDYRIISQDGFTEDDLSKVSELYGEYYVTRYMSFNTEVQSGVETLDDTISLISVENINVSGFTSSNKEEYNEYSEGLWLSEKYAESNNVNIGEELEIKYNDKIINVVVTGLIKSSEHMIFIQDSTQIMPDYDNFGYAYISPSLLEDILEMKFYTQIHVITNDEKEEFKLKIDNALNSNSTIVSKDDTVSYSGSSSEVEEGKIMGSILPVVFLVISILTMVTTMNRITNKERIQIGTLSALGFRKKKIMIHYSLYALIVGIVGIVLGILLGYFLAYFIINPNGSMSTYIDMPYWDLYIPTFCYLVLGVVLLTLMFVGGMSIHNILKHSTLEILKPNTKNKMKSLKIENSKLFQKLSFSTRWNLRDILQNKTRTLMSLFGVIGCMVILIAALGMNDTMNNFSTKSYDEALNYNNKINLSDNITDDKLNELIDIYDADYSSSLGIKIDELNLILDIYNIENDYVKFIDSKGGFTKINNDGAYICTRLAEELDLTIGDNINILLYGSDITYEIKISGILSSISKNIVITEEYAKTLELSYTVDSLYTNEDVVIEDGIKSIQSKESFVNTFDTLLEIMYIMITMFVIIGLILCLVVLYNLGVMGYSEKYREMATLKVLGFKDKKISKLLITQNLWLSIIGIIIGIPLGYFTLVYLLNAISNDYEMILTINLNTYISSVLLNVGISFIVSLMVARKNKNINMVEALKAIE